MRLLPRDSRDEVEEESAGANLIAVPEELNLPVPSPPGPLSSFTPMTHLYYGMVDEAGETDAESTNQASSEVADEKSRRNSVGDSVGLL